MIVQVMKHKFLHTVMPEPRFSYELTCSELENLGMWHPDLFFTGSPLTLGQDWMPASAGMTLRALLVAEMVDLYSHDRMVEM